MKNWKTTSAALLAVLPQLLHLLFPKVISTEVANTLSGLLVSLGLIAAKDGSTTSGTVINSPNSAEVVRESAQKDQ